MAGDKLSFRTWWPFAVIALVVLGGAMILCGLVGMMALTRSETALSSPGTGRTTTTPPFIRVGGTYEADFVGNTLIITVLEIGEGGWVRADVAVWDDILKKRYPVGQGWINLNQAYLVRESKP